MRPHTHHHTSQEITLPIRGTTIAMDFVKGGDDLLVFLHGVGSDRTIWKEQVRYFAERGYSIAAIDLRGSGDSGSHDDNHKLLPITRSEFAHDVHEVILALGFPKADWIGNSMGGVICFEALQSGLTTIAPERGAKIVLCNTFARHNAAEEMLKAAPSALQTLSLPELAAKRIPFVAGDRIEQSRMDEIIQSMAKKDLAAYLAASKATWSGDYRQLLSTIKNHALVISGSNDMVTPISLSEEIARGIPHARHVTLEGASHLSNVSNPAEFNSLVYAFLG